MKHTKNIIQKNQDFKYQLLNQITHPVREAFHVLSTAVASAAFLIYSSLILGKGKTQRMAA